jgi:uncharacterized protein (DUF2062 family)
MKKKSNNLPALIIHMHVPKAGEQAPTNHGTMVKISKSIKIISKYLKYPMLRLNSQRRSVSVQI